MKLRKYLYLFLIIITPLSLNAENLVLEKEKPYKQKIELIIDNKIVKKNVTIYEEWILALGDKGYGKDGAKLGVGGYCNKFVKREGYYKKDKIFMSIIIFKSYENCLKKIESYKNAKDNMNNDIFVYSEMYLSKKATMNMGGILSWRGMDKYIDKVSYISELQPNKQKDISIWYYKNFDENNLKAKKFIETYKNLLNKFDNSDLTKSQLQKRILKEMSFLSAPDFISAIKILISILDYNSNTALSCSDSSYSSAQSFNKKENKFIGNDEGIEKANFILKKLKNPNGPSNLDIFEKFQYDEVLSKSNFASTISEIFDYCEDSGLFEKVLIQSRN